MLSEIISMATPVNDTLDQQALHKVGLRYISCRDEGYRRKLMQLLHNSI